MKEFSKLILVSILFLIPFQDLINSLFYKVGLPSFFIFSFGILKEVLIFFFGISLIVHNKGRVPKRIAPIYLLIVYVFILFVVNRLPWDIKIGGLRQYLLLFISIVTGYFFNYQYWKDIISSRLFSAVLGSFVIFCYLQHFILPLSIFKNYFPILEMKSQALNLQTSNEHLNTGLPINYIGEAGSRMLGPFNEPLYTAYFALPFFNYNLWSYFQTQKKSRLVITTLFFLIIMLSQTRAVILVALLYFFLCIKNKIDFKIIGYTLLGAVILLSFNADWINSLIQSMLTTEGRSADHYLSYVLGVKLIFANLWGTGLGSGSVIATFLGGNNTVSLSVENAFINISLDLGVLIALVFLAALMINYFRGEKVRKSLGIAIPSPYNILILQFVLMGFLAPHILTIRVLIPYMLIVGLAIKTSQNENLYHNSNYNR